MTMLRMNAATVIEMVQVRALLDAMEILGPDLTRFRLRQALDLLGGVSKKENKEWEKLLGAIA